MIVTIHQPEHLIWLGLVDKISRADIFVVLDNVQFEKNNVQNRNKIRTVDGWQWLTVPVKSHSLHTMIKDIEIAGTAWREKYLNTLKANYAKAPYFSEIYAKIEAIIMSSGPLLSDLNYDLIMLVLNLFGLSEKKIVKASSLGLPEVNGGSKVCLQICKNLGADIYLSGPSGEHYLNFADFAENNIKIEFHRFNHPVYKQLFDPFVPCMSVIDLFFNYGPKAKEILYG